MTPFLTEGARIESVDNSIRALNVAAVSAALVTLAAPVDTLAEQYVQLTVGPDQLARARALGPFYEREIFGRVAMFFEGRDPAALAGLGDVRTPSIADLFVAKMQAS